MATCNQKDLYESMPHCEGEINMPGINGKVYFAPLSAIVTWPTIKRSDDTSIAALKEIQAYTGNFVLGAEAKWRYIDVIRDKSPVTFETQGEEGSKSFINKAELKVAGTKDEVLAFAAMMNNSRGVFLVQRSDGRYVVLGSKFFNGAKVTPTGALGAAPTDEHATTLTIEAIDFVALPLYPGTILTEAGEISGETGEPIPAA